MVSLALPFACNVVQRALERGAGINDASHGELDGPVAVVGFWIAPERSTLAVIVVA